MLNRETLNAELLSVFGILESNFDVMVFDEYDPEAYPAVVKFVQNDSGADFDTLKVVCSESGEDETNPSSDRELLESISNLEFNLVGEIKESTGYKLWGASLPSFRIYNLVANPIPHQMSGDPTTFLIAKVW
jgi:hypothetical protein